MARRAILRLFPRVESVWSNTFYSDTSRWQRDRLVCSEQHFPTYFALSVNEGAISAAQSEQLIELAGNSSAIGELLLKLLQQSRPRGGTRAALALEELTVRSDDIKDANVPGFLAGLFSVADDLNVKADEARGFSISSNDLRIQWLLNNLVRDRFSVEARSELIEAAAQFASLEWLASIASRCRRDHYSEKNANRGASEAFVSIESADRIWELCRTRLESAAADGAMAGHPHLVALLYRWRDASNAKEVRKWTDNRLADDEFVISLAEQTIQTAWTQSMGFAGLGDVVAKRRDYIDLTSLSELVDVSRLRERVTERLSRNDLPQSDRDRLERFMATPERDPRRDL